MSVVWPPVCGPLWWQPQKKNPRTQRWEECDRHVPKASFCGICSAEFPMRPWCLNSADNGKWQVSPLEAAQQEVLLHLLPPNTVSWWHPGNPESFWAARWTPDGSFFFFLSAAGCLKPSQNRTAAWPTCYSAGGWAAQRYTCSFLFVGVSCKTKAEKGQNQWLHMPHFLIFI